MYPTLTLLQLLLSASAPLPPAFQYQLEKQRIIADDPIHLLAQGIAHLQWAVDHPGENRLVGLMQLTEERQG